MTFEENYARLFEVMRERMTTKEYAEKYGTYWEARARVKVRPESKKCFQNVHTESFKFEPTDEEATAQIERNNPHLKVERIESVRDMTHKAAELTNYYNTKSFTGDW